MKQYIPCRIAALQDKLRERGLDAALIYDRENLIYFAGDFGSGGRSALRSLKRDGGAVLSLDGGGAHAPGERLKGDRLPISGGHSKHHGG